MKLSLVAKYTLLLFAGVVLGVRAQAVYAHGGPDAGQGSATVKSTAYQSAAAAAAATAVIAAEQKKKDNDPAAISVSAVISAGASGPAVVSAEE